MSVSGDIKNKIETELGVLKTATTIGAFESLDFKKNPVDLQDVEAFPYVLVSPPSIETSEVIDNRTHFRTYKFEMFVAFKRDNITTDTTIEDTLEAIMDHFDDLSDDFGGLADGGINPSVSTPEPIESGGKLYVIASVTLEIRNTKSLTFA